VAVRRCGFTDGNLDCRLEPKHSRILLFKADAPITDGRNNLLKRIDGPIIEYGATTAEEFWDILSPRKHLFGPQNKPIFRGQANNEWKLEPSILRKDAHPIYSELYRPDTESSEYRILAEIGSLEMFAENCDSVGLIIPRDSTELRMKLFDYRNATGKFILPQQEPWPSSDYFDIMALAQHHGLPTRLLDWSRSAYKAAYFAALGPVESGNRNANGTLAVWALDTAAPLEDMNIKIVKTPGSNNANVAAQSGLFTLLRQKYKIGVPFEGEHCLDDHIRSLESDALVKITLPLTEATKIIDLCEKHGITMATLKPDFYGAAQATRIRLKWQSMSERTDGADWADSSGIRTETHPAYVGPAASAT